MTPKLKKMAKATLARISLIMFRVLSLPYWRLARMIIEHWGSRGLHPITLGEFSGGTTKRRSLYREEMLIKTMVLFINIRGRSCLDLACNDGFWSFRLGRFGLKSVTGIDRYSEAIVRANFLKNLYGFPSFQFKQADLLEFLYDDHADSYDIILFLSILYHLPDETDWSRLFHAIARRNNECLIIDSRWFENDEYWYDRTSKRAVIKTKGRVIRKWRPVRKAVFQYLYRNGYEQIIDINPSAFLLDPHEAFGNGDPYTPTLENVCDYITGNRTLVIAYKKKAMMPNVWDKLRVEYVERSH